MTVKQTINCWNRVLIPCFIRQHIYFCSLFSYINRWMHSSIYYLYESWLWTFCVRVPSGVEYEWNMNYMWEFIAYCSRMALTLDYYSFIHYYTGIVDPLYIYIYIYIYIYNFLILLDSHFYKSISILKSQSMLFSVINEQSLCTSHPINRNRQRFVHCYFWQTKSQISNSVHYIRKFKQ